MDTTANTISISSYNCQYANELRLPFFEKLFHESDFLLIQEHGLYADKLDWFSALGDVCVHGVSAMDARRALRGRPHGGAAIVWRAALAARVEPVPWDATRMCAVEVHLQEGVLLLVNVYMPCDDGRPDANVREYKTVLDEIVTLCNSSQASFLCIMGDFNTDLRRTSPQTNVLKNFIESNELSCTTEANSAKVPFTYCSKINGLRSRIDHCLLSCNIQDWVQDCHIREDVDNPSDHVGVRVVLSCPLEYAGPPPAPPPRPPGRAWAAATPQQLQDYRELLDEQLGDLELPLEALQCVDHHCTRHCQLIDMFHDNLIEALIYCSEQTIDPTNKKKNRKKLITGWNNYVEKYFQASLFWHRLWVANDRPQSGIIDNIRRTTRANYHKARKYALKHENVIQSDNLVDSLQNESSREFWSKVRRCRGSKPRQTHQVDGKREPEEIAEVFKSKFSNVYNVVSYSQDDMNELNRDISTFINSYEGEGEQPHLITPEDVKFGLSKLKMGKKDGWLQITSENLLHGSDLLHGHLSLLFSCMMSHGYSPGGMLVGTMVPLPKGRFAAKSKSVNYRAITLSSLLGKILDQIILKNEADKLATSDQQFSYKKKLSTTACTSVIRETISYFNHKGTSVYGLMLDATQAFDRVEYCKLFRLLLIRDVNPFICRLLLRMYTNQELRVRWGSILSESFSVSNGVKQGGVISPILYTIYTEGLLTQLRNSNVGCFMGSVYVGVIAYADDIMLLAPSVYAIKSMLKICLDYANEFRILFNDKSKLIVFNPGNRRAPCPHIVINGKKIEAVESVKHLGHIVGHVIKKTDTSKCTGDLAQQCNSLLGDFNSATSCVRNTLFQKYCMSFYGSQFIPLYDACLEDLCRAWRVAIRRVWRLPWTTHCRLLPHLAGTMPPELLLARRGIAFAHQIIKSKNEVVKTIAGMARCCPASILGTNIRHLEARYGLDVRQVDHHWSRKLESEEEEEVRREANQIKELCYMRDSGRTNILSIADIKEIITLLCTE